VSRIVTAGGDGPVRLDTFVRRALPALSRRVTRLAIAEGAVRVNGRPGAKGTLVQPGDRVTLPDVDALAPEPDLPVAVVYEDAALVVVDKPGGLAGHALDPRERHTVAAFLVARHPEVAAVGEPPGGGLVHRLDRGTSGLLVAARTGAAFRALRAAFRARAVEKRYLAVVAGRVRAACRIELPLAHDPRDRRRMVPAAAGLRAWPAVTEVAPVALGADRSLIVATMRTGVTHQVRVHLALAGHPVLGDALYGAAIPDLPAGRHALHAAALRLPHPTDGRPLELASALPPDLRALAPG
jgi:23S rRNA pseudouridine1911/1915/1917 synthase